VPGGNDASTDVTLAIDQSPAPDATGKIALKDSTFARVGYGIPGSQEWFAKQRVQLDAQQRLSGARVIKIELM
jgi:hypothetical protein